MNKQHAVRGIKSEAAITPRHADQEIAHLEKIFRLADSRDIGLETDPYWRKRVEHLLAEPLLLPQQRTRLDALLGELNSQPMHALTGTFN
jgi:hypothetical protein